METKYAFKNEKHFADMNSMRLAGLLCDVTIKVNGREFQAHKNVLAANLMYFKLMFLNGGFQENKENVVTMKHLDEECFELFLTYAYTGQFTLTKSNALGVLEVANYLDEDTIKKECINFLKKHLGKSDACRAYQFAIAIECVPLQTVSRTSILSNFEYCSHTAEYLDFDCDSLKNILCDINLYPESQQSYFEGIMWWILHDVEKRKIHVKDLLNLVDMNKLAPDYVIKYFCKITKDQRDIATDIMMIYHDKAQKQADLNQNSKNVRESKTSNRSLMIVGIDHQALKMQFYDFTKQKWSLPCEIMYLDQATIKQSTTFRNQLYYTVYKGDSSFTHIPQLQVFDLSRKKNTMLTFERRLLKNSAVCACTEMLYFCGGQRANDGCASNQVLRYDPRTNRFQTLPPMRAKRASAAAIFYQGYILVLGGFDEEQGALSSVEKYDPVTNQWLTFPSMLNPQDSFEVALLNGKLYACGWMNYGEVYDPSVNSWYSVTSIDRDIEYYLIIAHEGKLLCIESGRKISIKVYDPSEDRSLVDQKMSTGLQLLDIVGGGLVLSNYVI